MFCVARLDLVRVRLYMIRWYDAILACARRDVGYACARWFQDGGAARKALGVFLLFGYTPQLAARLILSCGLDCFAAKPRSSQSTCYNEI